MVLGCYFMQPSLTVVILTDRPSVILHVHSPTVNDKVLKIITGNECTPTLILIGVACVWTGPIALSIILVVICVLRWSDIGWVLTGPTTIARI